MLDSVRPATPQDAAAIAALVNAAYRPTKGGAGWTHEAALVDGERTNPEQVEELLARTDGVMLIGCSSKATLACVDLRGQDREITIGMLAVHPTQQNSGLGKIMLAHAEECAVQRFNAERLLMHVLAARHELIDFYRRRGYELSGKSAPYPDNIGAGTPRLALRLVEMCKRPETGPIEK